VPTPCRRQKAALVRESPSISTSEAVRKYLKALVYE
jgi:hypothetical protein